MLASIENLRLSLNGTTVLRDVNLHLDAGEIYGLLGPNGAGKTTTIEVLLGLHEPGAGRLRVFEEPLSDCVALRRRIGVMCEHGGFYEWMSATDYLVWYGSFYGGLQQSVTELLALVGLHDAGRRPIGRFSRGMRQRLALARALVNAPELLILDEPTDGLDPRARRYMHDTLIRLARERRVGILLCTHLLDDVERLCQRVGIIHRGRTVAEGDLPHLLGGADVRQRFRLRVSEAPGSRTLPRGVTALGHEGRWWHLGVAPREARDLARLWRELGELGWGYTEIHAEAGSLEMLYLDLTSNGGGPSPGRPS